MNPVSQFLPALNSKPKFFVGFFQNYKSVGDVMSRPNNLSEPGLTLHLKGKSAGSIHYHLVSKMTWSEKGSTTDVCLYCMYCI